MDEKAEFASMAAATGPAQLIQVLTVLGTGMIYPRPQPIAPYPGMNAHTTGSQFLFRAVPLDEVTLTLEAARGARLPNSPVIYSTPERIRRIILSCIAKARNETSHQEEDVVVEAIARLCRIKSAVASPCFMPDFHVSGKAVVGTVLCTPGTGPGAGILPAIIGNDIACGILSVLVEVPYSINARILELVKGLLKGHAMCSRPLNGGSPQLSTTTALTMLHGGPSSYQLLGGTPVSGLSNVWAPQSSDLNLAQTVSEVLTGNTMSPSPIISRFIKELGTIGSGNHYAEVHTLDTHPHSWCKWTDPAKHYVAIVVHSGSRCVGEAIANWASRVEDGVKCAIKALEGGQVYASPDLPMVWPADHYLSQRYMLLHTFAARYATLNRMLVFRSLHTVLRKAYDVVLPFEIISDLPHNVITRHVLPAESGDVPVFIHRKGSTYAPNRLSSIKDADGFAPNWDKSIPAFVGSSMGTSGCFMAVTASSPVQNLGALPHGTGRVQSRQAARNSWASVDLMTKFNTGRLLVVDHPADISEEAPGAYQPLQVVREVCEASGIGEVLCLTKPVISIKG